MYFKAKIQHIKRRQNLNPANFVCPTMFAQSHIGLPTFRKITQLFQTDTHSVNSFMSHTAEIVTVEWFITCVLLFVISG